ncbi:MAG TPA: CPBP family intramembrane glutamic endopeptidase [Actinomycetota bacterium]|nr:CPBP family intramembrane glutamic endopeptidase [Actinomycetota bacterium]
MRVGKAAVPLGQVVADPARVATPVAIGLGLVALAARAPSHWVWLVTAGVGVAGLLAPVPAVRAQGSRDAPSFSLTSWLMALAIGLAAMVIAARLPGLLGLRPHGAGRIAFRVAPLAVFASVVAAVAEEIFFRRLVYGWLVSSWGTVAAICGSAVAFAAIHVPVYGVAVLPIDTAAGLLLGWQRWMTGGWSASGLTHVAANLIAEGVIP